MPTETSSNTRVGSAEARNHPRRNLGSAALGNCRHRSLDSAWARNHRASVHIRVGPYYRTRIGRADQTDNL